MRQYENDETFYYIQEWFVNVSNCDSIIVIVF